MVVRFQMYILLFLFLLDILELDRLERFKDFFSFFTLCSSSFCGGSLPVAHTPVTAAVFPAFHLQGFFFFIVVLLQVEFEAGKVKQRSLVQSSSSLL